MRLPMRQILIKGFHWVKFEDDYNFKPAEGLGNKDRRDVHMIDLTRQGGSRCLRRDMSHCRRTSLSTYTMMRISDGGQDVLCSSFNGVGIWKPHIRRIVCCKSLVVLNVKSGSRIVCWHDLQCTEQPQKLNFHIRSVFLYLQRLTSKKCQHRMVIRIQKHQNVTKFFENDSVSRLLGLFQ